MPKILFVDDDDELAELCQNWFEDQNFVVEIVLTGTEALSRLSTYVYDVIVLDLGLPDIVGTEIIREFRSTTKGNTPIIVLTGRSDVKQKEYTLDLGADDYVTKPFHFKELTARIRAVLRRPAKLVRPVFQVCDLVLDPSTNKVTRAGVEIEFTVREFAILEFLMRHSCQSFTAEMIMQRAWSAESETSPEAVRVYIARLRRKIDLPGMIPLLHTHRGFGYKIGLSNSDEEKMSDLEQ